MGRQGFTLVELIVVIAIIAILSAVIAPNAYRAIEKAKVTRVMADVKSFQTAGLGYYSDVGLWPPDVCPSEDPGFMRWDAFSVRCCGSTTPTAAENVTMQSSWNGPYLEKGFPNTPWGGSYDWEHWPTAQWLQQPGTYVSVRTLYGTIQKGQSCGIVAAAVDSTSVPDRFQIQLQQEGVDLYHPNGVDSADDNVITQIMRF